MNLGRFMSVLFWNELLLNGYSVLVKIVAFLPWSVPNIQKCSCEVLDPLEAWRFSRHQDGHFDTFKLQFLRSERKPVHKSYGSHLECILHCCREPKSISLWTLVASFLVKVVPFWIYRFFPEFSESSFRKNIYLFSYFLLYFIFFSLRRSLSLRRSTRYNNNYNKILWELYF